MNICAIIVAGGGGSRMGSKIPKQFLLLNNLPVLMHTINNIYDYDRQINFVVVLPDAEIEQWEKLCIKYNFNVPHQTTAGGKERYDSVKNGLKAAHECDLIAIHDGVRPLVSHETLKRCFDTADEKGSAIPVLPANESIREGTMNNSRPVERSRLYLVQTPQVFKSEIIRNAYNQPWSPEFTDDASVVEKYGVQVQMVLGNRENIKITYPVDLEVASLFLKKK
jgi:2-C-methyl-D-erythritol 4-phosphate cytidylyltransferase